MLEARAAKDRRMRKSGAQNGMRLQLGVCFAKGTATEKAGMPAQRMWNAAYEAPPLMSVLTEAEHLRPEGRHRQRADEKTAFKLRAVPLRCAQLSCGLRALRPIRRR